MAKDTNDPLSRVTLLAAAHKVCIVADKNTSGNKLCNLLHEKAIMGEISTEDFLRRNLALCSKDSEAKNTMKKLLSSHLKD